ncbi:MAG: ribonuclease HIII [Kiritimatiellia bacterium]|jgi:ribonuclease HIII
MPPKTSFTFSLDREQQDRLHAMLAEGNFRPVTVPYTRIAVQAPSWNCNINLYTSGKCLIQGAGAEEFVVNILEPMILQRIVVGYEEVLAPEALAPHMGIDESGKGDFFGPLVIAAAYTNEEIARQFREIGVKDSKSISSDKQALAIAAKIRGVLGPNRYTVVRIGNATYNRLYAKMRSVNRLLSWGHARCIENLLATIPSCPKAISDQFGNKESVQRALMQKGRSIELVQRHRAEADIAVAAASILAREGFLASLRQLEKQHGQPFPKGASPQVREAAGNLVKAKGPEILVETAKCHFKTLDAVLDACGRSRSDLPPECQVVSQDSAGRDFRRPKRPKGEDA